VTQEILCTGTTHNIVDLVKQCNFPPEAFLLVERLPQQVVNDDSERQALLRFARLRDGVDIAPYTSGRIFNKKFELRWEKDAGTIKVIYLGEEREIAGLTKQKEPLKPAGDLKHYYLFGERLDAADLAAMGLKQGEGEYTAYAEVRIPRLLRYPISKQAQRVQLIVGEYINSETGRVFRFQDLVPAE